MSHFLFPVLYSKMLCHVRMGLNGVAFLGLTKRKAGLEVFRRTAKVFQTHRRIRWETVALQTVMYCNTNRFQTKSKGAGKSRKSICTSQCMVAPTCSQHQKRSRSIQPARNAWFSSTCYHASLPPHALTRPREFGTFFLFGGLFPIPGAHRKRQLPPRGGGAPREPQIQQYWFLYNRRPRSFVQNVKAQELYEQKTVPVFKKIKKACTVLLSS